MFAASKNEIVTGLMAKKIRIDNLLVARGFFDSREGAQRAIMAGEVRAGDHAITKSSDLVTPDAKILPLNRSRFHFCWPQTSAIESRIASIAAVSCADVMQRGGMSTMMFRSGRVSKPRSRAARQTSTPSLETSDGDKPG